MGEGATYRDIKSNSKIKIQSIFAFGWWLSRWFFCNYIPSCACQNFDSLCIHKKCDMLLAIAIFSILIFSLIDSLLSFNPISVERVVSDVFFFIPNNYEPSWLFLLSLDITPIPKLTWRDYSWIRAKVRGGGIQYPPPQKYDYYH